MEAEYVGKKDVPEKEAPEGRGPGLLKRLLTNKKLLIIAGIAILTIVGGICYFLAREKPDKTPPVINLTSPTADDWYTTNESTVTIEGFAVDKSGIKSVTWESDKGESGMATVSDDSWTIANVSLSQGDNKITITATDNKGNSSSVVLNIAYNADVLFYDLTLSQDSIFKGADAEAITVRVGVEAAEGKTISEVKLSQFTNGEEEQLTEMFDNGKVANGDDIPADGIYSTIYSFSSDTLDPIVLRVRATLSDNVVAYSGEMTIKVLEQPSSEQISAILDANAEINQKYEEFKESRGPAEAADALVSWLQEREDIETAGASPDGLGVWWEYKETGILGGIFHTAEGRKSREQINAEAIERSEQGEVRGITTAKLTPVRFSTARPAHAAGADLEVKSTKAIYLGPYYSDFGNSDDYHHAWQTILSSKCPECQTTEKKDASVTVEDFKTLSNYGLIVISSHGDTWFGGTFGTTGGKVVTLTSHTLTLSNYLSYLPDLLLQRLAIHAGNNALVVLPSFITRYNGTFPNSLVYLSTCRSSYNFTMASAYLSKGAKAFYGYSDYVIANYAGKVGKEMMESFLTKGRSAGESWLDATSAHGASDGGGGGYSPAYFDIWGHPDLKMGGRELQNGGFEDKLVGWDTSGDARVITSLASLTPREGKRMAIISTGLGAVTDSISTISQTLCTTEGKLSVSFKFDFVSEEPMEYYGSAYDDYFSATVYINDSPTTLVRRSINNSTWTKIGGINFAGGDGTTFHTGWTTVSKDLGNVKQGDTVKIVLKVGDKGDSIYDSAAIIDSIKLEIE